MLRMQRGEKRGVAQTQLLAWSRQVERLIDKR
jgi:hypothetical protein